MLRNLGKASFINGSQFIIAWVTPRGEVDIFASELLQSCVPAKGDDVPGVIDRQALQQEALRVKGQLKQRWEDSRRSAAQGELVSTLDDDEEGGGDAEDDGEGLDDVDGDDDENLDADITLVEASTPIKGGKLFTPISSARKYQSAMDIVPPRPSSNVSAPSMTTVPPTPGPPKHTITLAPDAIESYYCERFAALQQVTCKLVVKAWIKIIEPKKQNKFPYNKGEDARPLWWPEGVRHREPDHLSKLERLTLLTTIIRSSTVSVNRLEVCTAEASAFISQPRQSIMREIFLVAKEEEKRRVTEGLDLASDLIVHLPHAPISPSQVSPEGIKRDHSTFAETPTPSMSALENKENVSLSVGSYAAPKRMKVANTSRLSALTTSAVANYDPYSAYYAQASSPNPWRSDAHAHTLGVSNAGYFSPYPAEWSNPGSEYGRSPNLDASDRYGGGVSAGGMAGQHHSQHASYPQPPPYHATNHLAPILAPGSQLSAAPTPMADAPTPTHSQGMTQAQAQSQQLMPMSSQASLASNAYYPPRHNVNFTLSLDIQQPSGQGYDYGSPYLADTPWDQTFADQATQ